jgi:tetratricopeptide (TPR) repeat protein
MKFPFKFQRRIMGLSHKWSWVMRVLGLVFFLNTPLNAETIIVKAADHKEFTRFVFQTKNPFELNHAVEEGQLKLQLKTKERIDLSKIGNKTKVKPHIQIVDQEQGQMMSISVQNNPEVKILRDRGMVIVDVYGALAKDPSGQREKKNSSESRPNTPTNNPSEAQAGAEEAKKPGEVRIDANFKENGNKDNIETLKDVLDYLEGHKQLVTGKNKAGQSEGSPSRPSEKVILKITKQHGKDVMVLSTVHQFPLAILQRGGASWLFLDTTDKPIQLIVAPSPKDSPRVDVKSQGGLLGVRIEGSYAINLSKVYDETIYSLKEEPIFPDKNIRLEKNTTESGVHYKFHIGSKRVFVWNDPDVGDTLFIAPTSERSLGVDNQSKWVDLDILPSEQGLIIKKNVDDLIVKAEDDSVIVSRPGGLRIASQSEAYNKVEFIDQSIFQMDDLQAMQNQSLVELKAKLQSQLINTEEERSLLYFNYGQALIVSGHFKEAQGAFKSALINNEVYDRDWKFQAHFALASIMAKDYSAARKALLQSKLRRMPESIFLMGVIDAELWSEERARKGLGQALHFLRQYPDNIRAHLGLVVLRALIHINELETASEVLGLLEQTKIPNQYLKEKMTYYKGHLYMAQKLTDEGRKIIEALVDSQNPRIRSKALFMNIVSQWESRKVTDEEALAKLDRLRLEWRHGSEYREIIGMITQLLIKQGNYPRALSILRQAYSKSNIDADKEHYGQKIANVVVETFTSESFDKIPVLSALAIFAEYKSFIAPATDFQKVLYPLLDRLEKFDLFAPAIEILEQRLKVHNYKSNEDKLKDGLLLVRFYINDEKTDKAQIQLDKIELQDLSPSLKDQYEDLKFRAFVLEQKFSDALRLLEGNDTLNNSIKRVMVYWHMNDWMNASKVLESIVEHPEKLEENQTIHLDELLVMLATAYNLTEQTEKILDLKDKFQEKIKSASLRDEFNLLTVPESKKHFATVNDIRSTLAQLDIYKQYMQNKASALQKK